jgi:hypothetical protein
MSTNLAHGELHPDFSLLEIETMLEERIEKEFQCGKKNAITHEEYHKIVMFALEILEFEFDICRPVYIFFDEVRLPFVTIDPKIPSIKASSRLSFDLFFNLTR